MSRRILSLLFASFVAVALFAAPRTASAAESVKLHTAFLGTQSKYGCTQYSGSFDILTSYFGHQKSVYIHLKEVDGSWLDIPATFVEEVPGGREVWRASIVYGQGACPTTKVAPDTFEFDVKVSTASGDTWDNNGGANYKGAKGSGSLLVDTNVVVGGAFAYAQGDGGRVLSVDAFLRNVAYGKTVDIVYTTNNWATVQTAPLSYTSSYTLGYGTYASPNSNGIEVWQRLNLTFATSCIDFAIRYRVNGAEYWDNNFGRNFHACSN